MERLTHFDGTSYQDLSSKVECVQKLGILEDAEEQGRLVMLPTAVGDIVYSIIPSRNIISTLKVKCVFVYEKGFFLDWELVDGIYSNICGCGDWDIGKTVFLSREEAEAALKEHEAKC